MLNAHSRDVRRDLVDCHQLHRTIMRGFTDLPADPSASRDARARLGVLFRLEQHPRTGMPSLLVQSVVEPDWRRLPGRYLLETGGEPPNPDQKSVDGVYAAIR